ncbi:MAG: holo-ACP synthase [Helicobacteraceae bacterium]|nr:holo-ACP synthase [Helicobacteraceae bacterium]
MIGIDVVAIERIEKIVQKYGISFLKRFLNKSEIKLVCRDSSFNINSIAGFFAAKEAISKALGCGIGKELGFRDIKIIKNIKNAPKIKLKKKIKKYFKIKKTYLSITHDKGYAIAVVLINFK